MARITIRHIPDDVHQAIRGRAKRNGRSMEAEVRLILEAIARDPIGGLHIGDELASLGRAFGGIDLDLVRPETPMRTAKVS